MLKQIIKEIREYPGITRKKDISMITNPLSDVLDFGNTVASIGEDAAVMRSGDSFILLAADGIWPGLIEVNPYSAGKASVMANVNDIYATGGRPLAMVNVVGTPDSDNYAEIVRGIKKGCEKFKVPMVGGHLHPDTKEPSLSVSIVGTANSLLLSDNALDAQDILFAVDMQGRGYQCKPVISWDTNSGKTSEQVLKKLEILPRLAEKGLCRTCKDVSNGGLLGTIALLMESSRKGAFINIDSISKPSEFPLVDWLKAFLSYGFVLCVDRDRTGEVIEEFRKENISCEKIGCVTESRKIILSYKRDEAVLFDLKMEPITGTVID